MDLENLREDYSKGKLEISSVDPNPFIQFQYWFQEALDFPVEEPNAMVLSTATPTGIPSARTVLLKNTTKNGFVFYTNYKSQKAIDLEENPVASLLFLWLPLQRQVRIRGKVSRQDSAASTKYFQSRPKGSQIGAWASPQSQVISDRAILENKVKQLEEQYKETEQLPKPEHWGGYIVEAEEFEFWQGRSSRLHDRIRYKKNEAEQWILERLAP